MLQYDRIDWSEGIDINKISESKECMPWYYWYFKDVGYKSQPYVQKVLIIGVFYGALIKIMWLIG